MLPTLTFDTLTRAWNTVKTSRAPDLKHLAPNLTAPEEIFVKRISEDESYLTVQFAGFSAASADPSTSVPQIKRTILTWLRKISMDVQIMRGNTDNELIVRISKELQATPTMEAKEKMRPSLKEHSKYVHRRVLTNIITSTVRRGS